MVKRKRVNRHSDETRAAVMAALLAGQGVNEVARTYHLDSGLVSRWKKKIPAAELQRIAAERTDEFSELLTNYLKETLKTLKFQVRFFRDKAWLADQSASEVAALHGVITDKAIRLLEAAQVAADSRAHPSIEEQPLESSPGSADSGVSL